MKNKEFTWWRGAEKAEALRTEDMGYSTEEYRHEVIRDKAQAGTGEPIATNMSLIAYSRTVDIELGKCGLGVKRSWISTLCGTMN